MFLKKNTQILLIGFIWEEEARNILLTINRAKTNFGGGGGRKCITCTTAQVEEEIGI